MTTLAEKKALNNGLHVLRPDREHTPSEELLLSYIPKTTKPIVEFSGAGILKPGYVSSIIGPAGFGKSNIIEALISVILNNYIDGLGFKVNSLTGPSLWIDGERTRDDIAIGFDRIKRRIQIDDNPDLIDSDRFKGIHCHPFITYPSREARIRELVRLVLSLHPGLVILDGAADFVRDVNDTAECVDFIAMLTALANEHNFGVITTIHPNPSGSGESKARGVLGSELIRTSESILLLKRAPDDRNTRIITTDFQHGKNRNGSDSLDHAFKWSPERRMFLSCDYSPVLKPGKTEEQNQIITDCLTEKPLSYSDLVKAIQQNATVSTPTAKRWISQAIDRQLIFKDNEQYKTHPF